MATFPKKERLCSKHTIQQLFQSKNRFIVYPLSIHWIETEPATPYIPLQVLFVAPKRKLRHAVDRNRVKRLMRECYRARKQELIDTLQTRHRSIALAINYLHDAPYNFHKMEYSFDKMTAVLLSQITGASNLQQDNT